MNKLKNTNNCVLLYCSLLYNNFDSRSRKMMQLLQSNLTPCTLTLEKNWNTYCCCCCCCSFCCCFCRWLLWPCVWWCQSCSCPSLITLYRLCNFAQVYNCPFHYFNPFLFFLWQNWKKNLLFDENINGHFLRAWSESEES